VYVIVSSVFIRVTTEVESEGKVNETGLRELRKSDSRNEWIAYSNTISILR